MYVPPHFEPDEADVIELLHHVRAADLVTATADGLLGTFLPLIYVPPDDGADTGSHGALRGHVARKNPQWQRPALGEALVIARGPDAYISPGWYETKREHGRVVPTWNYITVHARGRLVIHDDPGWVEANVRSLSTKFEAPFDPGWSVDDAPPPFIAGQLRAIVGVEMLIDDLQGKFKLSQNRGAADVEGAIAGLEAIGDSEMADAMRDAVTPRRASR